MPNVKTEMLGAEGLAQGDIVPHVFGADGGEQCPLSMDIAELSIRELVAALPDTLAEMSRVVKNVRAVLKITEHFGGTRVCFSLKPKADGKLARLIGLPAARALGKNYGGQLVEIARASAVQRAIRNRKICRLREQGVPGERIALRFGITGRQVKRIFKNKEKP